jgi:probable F420-dependent oxidoreductase
VSRPFRFGVQHTHGSREEWQAFARKAEDLGFSTLVVQDHFGPQLAPLPSLMSAAAATSRIRLGTLLLDNDFRHPAAMVKEAASVDVLSDGRLELGLGAGWLEADYAQTGIPFESPAVRFARLREAVAITRAFFAGEPVTFHGEHYRIEGLDPSPRPVQQPGPPLLIGGRQRQLLSFAAREADIVSVSMIHPRVEGAPPPPTFAEKVEWVRAAAGDRFADIEIHANASNTEITDDRRDALARLTERLGVSEDVALQQPANLVGSVDAVCAQLEELRERTHVSYVVVQHRVMDAFAPVVARLEGR